MSWSLNFDGVNDYATIGTPVLVAGDYTLRVGFLYESGSNQTLLGNPAGSDDLIRFNSTTSILFKLGSNSFTLTLAAALVGGTRYIFRFTRSGTTLDLTDDVGTSLLTATKASAANLDLHAFGRFSAGQYWKGDIEYFEYYSDATASTPVNKWDATASSHASGTPILTDTVAANNATGVNMPTDGSAWVDLGGVSAFLHLISGGLINSGRINQGLAR